METDIKEVRKTSIALMYTVPIKIGIAGIVQHPFTNSSIVPTKEMTFLNLEIKEEREKWYEMTTEIINSLKLHSLYNFVGTAWKLTWLMFVKPSLSKRDFSELLATAWVEQENPNMDANVSRKTLISWFKNADKKTLMQPEDYKYWENLPDELTVYRGVSVGRIDLGLSWTDSKEKAEWFQHRFENYGNGKKGHLLKATISKKHVMCYFNTRDEQETVVDVFAIKDLIEQV